MKFSLTRQSLLYGGGGVEVIIGIYRQTLSLKAGRVGKVNKSKNIIPFLKIRGHDRITLWERLPFKPT